MARIAVNGVASDALSVTPNQDGSWTWAVKLPDGRVASDRTLGSREQALDVAKFNYDVLVNQPPDAPSVAPRKVSTASDVLPYVAIGAAAGAAIAHTALKKQKIPWWGGALAGAAAGYLFRANQNKTK
jgi:hypothetical protein